MITLTGKFDRVLRTDRNAIVSFTIPNYQAGWLKDMDTEVYNIEIKKPKSRKSLQQNNFAWQLITEIARELSYYPDPESVYKQIVKLARIKTVFLETLNDEKVIKELGKTFRIVEIREERKSNGVDTVMLECYYGMSVFDKEEMTRFIEVLLDYATQNGIDVREYER